jgi:hypothetical protein
MSQGYTVDARLPVSKGTSENDPNHPKNVIKNMLEVQQQTAADTKYDVNVSRIENFSTEKEDETVYLIAALLGILIGITLALKFEFMIARIVFFVAVAWCIRYAVDIIEKRTVYN